MTHLGNKVTKPLLHTVYDGFFYPLFVFFRTTLSGLRMSIKPLWWMTQGMVSGIVKFFQAFRPLGTWRDGERAP